MRVAVIDIGSNAIRAAIYDGNQLGAAEIFNEKFKSDITALCDQESLDIKHSTYNIFNYFIHIFKLHKVENIYCVATEILRNHKRADEFILHIQDKYGLKVRVLSGAEEAEMTSLGLISSIPDAEGIAADLGGGSLEIAEIYGKKVHKVTSLSLGTKVLGKMQIDEESYILEALSEEFQTSHYDNLYLIGGSLRLLGRCYMDCHNSIIKNLHNLIICPEQFLEFLDQLETLQRFQKFFRQYKISKPAITVMKGLINYFKPKKLIFSTFGLKEGVRYGILSSEEQKKDIAYERCINFASSYIKDMQVEKYVELFKTVASKFSNNQIMLLKIVLILSQYPRHVDRNYRAEYMINFILSTDIPFNQHQRASLITALAQALSSKTNIVPKDVKRIISKEENAEAKIIGSFVKIVLMLDGPVLTEPSFSFKINNKYIEIDSHYILPKTIFDKVCDMLKSIGISLRYASEK